MSAADVVAVTGSLDLTSLSFNLPPLLPLTAGLTLTLTSPNDADVWRFSDPSKWLSVHTSKCDCLENYQSRYGVLEIYRRFKNKWFTFRFETFEKITMTFCCACMITPFTLRPDCTIIPKIQDISDIPESCILSSLASE